MLWTIIGTPWLSGMPETFESISTKDAEVIMQTWADRKKTRRDRPEIGKLQFEWDGKSGINTCVVSFSRNGKRMTFMKIAELKENL